MGIQGNIDLNFWLTRALAKRLGVNLTEAMHNGFLTESEFAKMITDCRCCGESNGCLAVLSEINGPLEEPPEYCRNAQILRELAALVRRH